ncbi:MAG: hypothetical protein MI824_03170 [Hyphomicrobiales bacterium]|nr:hypothetical protein [Hyphomicrobiales bacterium]
MYEPHRHVKLTLWEELRPGYAYLWRRLTGYRHHDPEDREETAFLGVFLFTFLPWLPIILLAHAVKKAWLLIGRQFSS